MSAMPAAASGTASKYDRLIAAAKGVPAVSTVVVHPCDESSLRGAIDSAEAGIIKAVLVGPGGQDQGRRRQHNLNISSYEIVDTAAHGGGCRGQGRRADPRRARAKC